MDERERTCVYDRESKCENHKKIKSTQTSEREKVK